MTEEMRKKLNLVKYKSMVDFSKQIDEIKNMDDKLAFAVEYLLSHTENVDCALDEAIEIARMKIADGVAEYKKMAKEAIIAKESKEAFPDLEHQEVDLKPYGNVLDNKKLDEFMAYPSLYLRKVGNQRVEELKNKIGNEDMTLKTEEQKADTFEHNINILTEYKMRLNLKGKERDFLHINSRLKTKFGSAETLEDAYKVAKPGFFSKMFNTSSIEGRLLVNTYKGFNDEKSPLYGRKDLMIRAANAYMIHAFPGWKPGNSLPDQNRIDQLSGTQKARVILSSSILEAAHKEETMLKEYEPAIKNVKDIEFDFNLESDVKKTNIVDLEKDLEDSLSNNSFDYSESENEISNNNIEM